MNDADKLRRAVASIRWMAQTVHNAHHGGEHWYECTHGICLSMEAILNELGYGTDGEPIETKRDT